MKNIIQELGQSFSFPLMNTIAGKKRREIIQPERKETEEEKEPKRSPKRKFTMPVASDSFKLLHTDEHVHDDALEMLFI